MEDANPVQQCSLSSSLFLGTHVLASTQYNPLYESPEQISQISEEAGSSTPDDKSCS